MNTKASYIVSTVLLLSMAAAPLPAAPRAELWAYWQAHDETSNTRVAHDAWAAFLGKYLTGGADGINRVRYAAVTKADEHALNGYINRLSGVTVTALTRDRQLAYWLNLYNALTVRVVLEHYPVESIRDIDISPGWFNDGPWDKQLVTIEGKALSLNDIEHRILRPIWRDPRVHYALNCASLGCPNLRREPYVAERIDAQLDDQARNYVNHSRGVSVTGGRVVLSRIYDWYRADFGGSDSSVLDHIRGYADPGLEEELKGVDSIAGYRYDWSLNDADSAPVQ